MKKIVFFGISMLLILGTAVNAKNRKKGPRHGGMMMHLDKNKDQKISKDEYMAKFTEIDANKDGFITRDEMKKHHQEMRKKMGDRKRPREDDETDD